MRMLGVWFTCVSALWCSPRVVFSVPAAGPAYDGAGISRLVVGPGGDLWVVGRVRSVVLTSGVASSASAPFVTRLDRAGNVRWRTVLSALSGTTIQSASSVAVDGAGNAYVVGVGKPSGPQILAWLAKLDPGGQVIAYCFFGGSRETSPSDIALDASGSPVVVGYTTSADFPTTPGAVGGPARQSMGTSYYGFVMRFLPDAKSLVFSTCLGGTVTPCGGGSRCIGVVGSTTASAVVLDGRGAIYVAGGTSATDFLPDLARGPGFLAVISADGSRFISATRMPSWPGFGSMRLTSAGHLVMGATAFGSFFATTPGAIQSTYLGCPGGFYWSGPYHLCHGGEAMPNGYVSEVDFSGLMVRGTYLGGRSAALNDLALDASGHIWISGSQAGDDFPVTADGMARGYDFLLKLDKDTFRVAQSTRLPYGVSGGSIAIGAGGELYLGSGSGLVSRVAFDGSGPAILGVASAAAWSPVTGEIAPGELVSVYGREIGPPEPAHLELDADGRVGTDLGGSRLFFQGLAAPLLYAQRDQINAVVPFGVAGMPEVNVELMQADKVVATQKVRVVDAKPVISGVLNPDGSLNSSSRPASKGAVVSIYAAGFGDLLPPPADGEVPTTVLPKPKAPVTVLLDANPAEVLYIGSAPGMVAGVMQVNIRAPDCRTCGLVLKVGTRATSTSLYVAR